MAGAPSATIGVARSLLAVRGVPEIPRADGTRRSQGRLTKGQSVDHPQRAGAPSTEAQRRWAPRCRCLMRPIVPYEFGCTIKVKNNDPTKPPDYVGTINDLGSGWDVKHHNVPPEEWIDIWKPCKAATQWGKQWRWVEICCNDQCK